MSSTLFDQVSYLVDPLNGVQAQSPENPATDLGAYDALVEASSVSKAGQRVTRESSLQVSSVWQAVDMISGDLAKLPFVLMEENGGNPRPQRQSDTYYRFAHQPNLYQNAVKFWRLFWQNRLLWNRAYAALMFNQRGVAELLPLLPDRTTLERAESGIQVYVTEVNGQLLWLNYEEVFHIHGLMDFYTWDGIDPIHKGREVIGKALARMNFASTFFRHGGRVGGILELPAGLPKPRRDQQESSFRRVYENVNEAFRTVVLRENAKFHAAQSTLEDTQMIESGQEDVREICRYFNVNPSRLGLEGGRAYNSKTEDNRDYLDTTLTPHMSAAIAEAEEKTLKPDERRFRKRWFRYETDELLRMNKLERYQAYEIGIRSEFLSPNDARTSEDLPPRPGGDQYGNPAINPQAHLELLEGICHRQTQIVRDRLNRRRTEPDERFLATSRDKFETAIRPALAAYVEVFGGDLDHFALAIAARYVQAIAITNEATEPILREVIQSWQSTRTKRTARPLSSSLESSETNGGG